MTWRPRMDGNYAAFQMLSQQGKGVFRASRHTTISREHAYRPLRLSEDLSTEIRFIQQANNVQDSQESPEALFPTSVLEKSDIGCFRVSEDG
jgi:hypothetical protein